MIEVHGLTKRFGDIIALEDVTFKVEKGQIVGFLGANGAGKTTTMDILCGCIGADQGTARIVDIDVTDHPEKAKAHLGYLPDEPPLHNDMKVKEYITYAAKLRKVPSKELKDRVLEAIKNLDLLDVQYRLVGNLSKGFRQRVGLAQAIVHDPDVLVLDEPTEGLDPHQIVHIRELIKSLAGRHTILLSSHILSEVQNTCDHIIIINQGKIIKQGTYEELVSSAESGTHYQLRVSNEPDRLAGVLRTMDGISNVNVSSNGANKIEFTIAQEDGAVDHVARAVLDGGHGLRELSSSRKSLEDVFLRLTH